MKNSLEVKFDQASSVLIFILTQGQSRSPCLTEGQSIDNESITESTEPSNAEPEHQDLLMRER